MTTVINQHSKFIMDSEIIKKVEHMVDMGYGSIVVDGVTASYEDERTVEGDRVIFIHVGEEDEDEA